MAICSAQLGLARRFELIGQMAMQTAEPIQLLCQTLDVSRAGYNAHRHKPEQSRRQQDQMLTPLICQAFADSRKSYGSPRLQMALRHQGQRCGKKRVARLMCQAGLRARQKRRYRPRTTQNNHGLAIAENWLAKVPAPARPNQVWVSDITYLPTQEGWLYLAMTLDACSRKVVGWPAVDAVVVFKEDGLGRVRMQAARREQLLAEFERSGLSGKKFAALAGIKYQTFATWAQKRR